MIVDEVMTGFGRTGTNFAIEHFGVEPDILTFGKGVSGGYAPLAGMVVSDKLVDSLIQYGNGRFVHGYTFSGHPVSVAAGLAAVRYYREKRVRENGAQQGDYLFLRLQELQSRHAMMGEVRGKGLLLGFELLLDQEKDLHFPPGLDMAERLNQAAMERGAVFYPGTGTVDGILGNHLLVAPPLTISRAEVDELVQILDEAVTMWEEQIRASLQ